MHTCCEEYRQSLLLDLALLFLVEQQHPRSTLFPYTTLFRSSAYGPLPANKLKSVDTFLSKSQPPKILLSTLKGLRSEEHTSELQSRPHLVCRLLLEKKTRGRTEDTRNRPRDARRSGEASRTR